MANFTKIRSQHINLIIAQQEPLCKRPFAIIAVLFAPVGVDENTCS